MVGDGHGGGRERLDVAQPQRGVRPPVKGAPERRRGLGARGEHDEALARGLRGRTVHRVVAHPHGVHAADVLARLALRLALVQADARERRHGHERLRVERGGANGVPEPGVPRARASLDVRRERSVDLVREELGKALPRAHRARGDAVEREVARHVERLQLRAREDRAAKAAAVDAARDDKLVRVGVGARQLAHLGARVPRAPPGDVARGRERRQRRKGRVLRRRRRRRRGRRRRRRSACTACSASHVVSKSCAYAHALSASQRARRTASAGAEETAAVS